MGLSISGSISIFGYKTGLKINILPKQMIFSGTILFPAFKLAGCKIARSKKNLKEGPTMSVNINIPGKKFSGSMQAYLNLGFVGSAEINLKVSSTGMVGIFSLNAFNLIQAEVQFQAGMAQKGKEAEELLKNAEVHCE